MRGRYSSVAISIHSFKAIVVWLVQFTVVYCLKRLMLVSLRNVSGSHDMKWCFCHIVSSTIEGL